MPTKNYETLVFCIHALTNLHPGAGDSFYGAVDKAVQRDAATGLPTINSHSLKGALREFFEVERGYKPDSPFIKTVFGSEVKADPKNALQGQYQFFSADLLSLPVPDRSESNEKSWHAAAASEALSDFVSKITRLGAAGWTADNFRSALETAAHALETGPEFARQFLETARDLPLVARNQLDDGKSENLWYEELVPHQALFCAVVRAPGNDAHLDAFKTALHEQVVQIGANATVGYGYCHFSELSNAPKEDAEQ